MSKLNHINYPDNKGRIYCRKQNKIITLDKDGDFWSKCQSCPLFAGDYQGLGVECQWGDSAEGYSEYVSNPTKELLRVSREIDLKSVSKDGKNHE